MERYVCTGWSAIVRGAWVKQRDQLKWKRKLIFQCSMQLYVISAERRPPHMMLQVLLFYFLPALFTSRE